jgi:hypothetical protein
MAIGAPDWAYRQRISLGLSLVEDLHDPWWAQRSGVMAYNQQVMV